MKAAHDLLSSSLADVGGRLTWILLAKLWNAVFVGSLLYASEFLATLMYGVRSIRFML